MAKTENVFKFAVIRTPQIEEKTSRRTIRFDNQQWVNRIIGLVKGNVTLDDARKRVSHEFMNSSSYFLRAPNWQPFLAHQTEIQSLLKAPANEAEFTSFLNALLKQINPNFNSWNKFVDSTEFKELKQSLWHSYYSNIALINHRPQDRPRIEFWIKFLYFLEKLNGKDSFKELTDTFNNWSLIVPNQLVQAVAIATPTEESEGTPNTPISSTNSMEVKKTIGQLQTVRRQIEQVFHAKLAEASKQEEDQSTPNSGGSKNAKKGPWILTAKEIGAEAAKTLTRLGLSLDAQDATQISALLENREAELESELFKLEHTKQIAFVRGVPVIVRRKDASNDQTKN
jgi:hypothetical protein